MNQEVRFTCPECGTLAEVTQVQGDRCPGCGFEFKRFDRGEERAARDYLAVLTGRKHFLPLKAADGFVVAHE